ncbi:MAG: acetyl-CoA carboxylase carboxyltransferase subunit beta [Rhodospirillaceae bacterium]|jgi:acetyl-CoA carboxylase carboxyl transferase subunit beta|nr:acetyl-CoA carboxylase carboxyltransferase subunit beta [Rhodospirillaceae bacterium]MBT3926609.1 acetyl-CoA carboxylase carboxyltransferase subunit beta [Rhodospirillaceae bacterium]MBT4427316.1 acetyl-CoA carboxylase carboxyltransferase subunit beta [Rhodospirillaceae bacterium]MBT5037514.1 acetyl-CoA carboxylase carboxyltransferase subunit beta [Rhodospirillaceae bacterium]MBT5676386.1 acetyl-CoA carboxylase carboxyltransferase subunit beta [Rhodospirillaceae bacterium]
MSWLDRFARPKVRGLFRKDDIPHDLWEKCPNCEQMIFHRELENNQRVCPHCDHHLRLDANKRLSYMFDDGEFQTIELPEVTNDPLRFRDRKRYADRLKDARSNAHQDAVIVAHGTIGGNPVVVAAFDFSFLGGSMGVAVGEALLNGARLAVLQDSSFIVVPASGGARMQEGTLSLMQMARTTIAVDELKEAHLPYIVVLTHPTTGGVTASFAMLGDIAIAEPGAVIGFAGARVIEDTIREKLPEGFQRAEHLLEHGMIDMVVRRHDLRDTLAKTISLLRNTAAPAQVVELARAETPAP